MNSLLCSILKRTITPGLSAVRPISMTSASRLKEIEVIRDEEKQSIVIQGKYQPSPQKALLVKEYVECQKNGTKFCPECTLGLDIKHTDVLILSQYVRPDGCMLPSRITGLCKRQQIRIGTLVTMAQKAGLMSNLNPSWSKKDPKKRFGFKKFNKYYLESTIQLNHFK